MEINIFPNEKAEGVPLYIMYHKQLFYVTEIQKLLILHIPERKSGGDSPLVQL